MGLTVSISNLFDRFFGKQKVRIVMLGLDAVGKTSILYHFKLKEFVRTIPTVGFNVETVDYKNISFTLWDVGGGDKAYMLWNYYFKDTDALIYIVDSNDRDRIEESSERLMYALHQDDLENPILLVLANKQDLPNAMKIPEITEKMGLDRLRGFTWIVHPTCAITGEGLYEGLEWLSTQLKNRK